MRSSLFVFLSIVLFCLALAVILFELALTRIFSVVLWYNYAFMAISIAFFGIGVGSLLIHTQKNRIIKGGTNSIINKITISITGFAASLPIFLVLVTYVISPTTSFLYLFYLASSVPFFFAGLAMALIYLAMPREINRLYFIDLAGSAGAALILDGLTRNIGAESVVLAMGPLVLGSLLIAYLVPAITKKRPMRKTSPSTSVTASKTDIAIGNRLKIFAVVIFIGSSMFLTANLAKPSTFIAPPGETKALNFWLKDTDRFEPLSTKYNSFSRIDVGMFNPNTNNTEIDNTGRALGTIS